MKCLKWCEVPDKNNWLKPAGVETTVDRSSKKNRIITWIKAGAERDHSEPELEADVSCENTAGKNSMEDLEDLDLEIHRITPQ